MQEVYKNFGISVNKVLFRWKFTFLDQLKVIESTDILIGRHGAGFINSIFLRPKSGIIQINAPLYTTTHIINISKKSYLFIAQVNDNIVKNPPELERQFRMLSTKLKYREYRDSCILVNLTSFINNFNYIKNKVENEKYRYKIK